MIADWWPPLRPFAEAIVQDAIARGMLGEAD
jgi:hypothetical protein